MAIVIVVPVIVITPVAAIIIDVFVKIVAFVSHLFLVLLPVFPGLITMILPVFSCLVTMIKLVLLQFLYCILAVITDIFLVSRVLLASFPDLLVAFRALRLALCLLVLSTLCTIGVRLLCGPLLYLLTRSLLALVLVTF